MEGLRADSEAARFIARALASEHFTLIDVGCSGGVDSIWDVFGESLWVYGFDASLEAVEQLNRGKKSDRFQFFAGFVGLRADHPFHQIEVHGTLESRNPWPRLAVARTVAIRDRAEDEAAQTPSEPPAQSAAAHAPDAATQDLLLHNQWERTALAERQIHLPDFLAEHAVSDIDFIKIDIDGPDFEVLVSLSQVLEDANVLALGLEVNFIGPDDPTQHVFHNTDRFMRAHGFELFELTVRKYAAAALPFIYADVHPYAHRAVGGRPFQGDALYVRDLGFDHEAERAARLSPDKILKLAAIFALAGHGDQAAEVLIQFRERLQPLLDVNAALDLLTLEAHDACAPAFSEADRQRSYAEYMAEFEANGPGAYGGDLRSHQWLQGWVERAHQAEDERRAALEQAEAAKGDLREAQARIDAMEQSKSWKITRWLRRVRRRIGV